MESMNLFTDGIWKIVLLGIRQICWTSGNISGTYLRLSK